MDVRHLTGRISPDFHQSRGKKSDAPSAGKEAVSFKEVLKNTYSLRFSGHALERLQSRSIPMDENDMMRLQEAVDRAEQKGGRDSLVLDGKQAFLVNIPNKTVVTAVDVGELREKVFTNIDSTVLTKRKQ